MCYHPSKKSPEGWWRFAQRIHPKSAERHRERTKYQMFVSNVNKAHHINGKQTSTCDTYIHTQKIHTALAAAAASPLHSGAHTYEQTPTHCGPRNRRRSKQIQVTTNNSNNHGIYPILTTTKTAIIIIKSLASAENS